MYIDEGAWVIGSFNITDTEGDVRIIGPGVLSGEFSTWEEVVYKNGRLTTKQNGYFIGTSPSGYSYWIVGIDDHLGLNCYPDNPPNPEVYSARDFKPDSAAGMICEKFSSKFSQGKLYDHGKYLHSCSYR